MADKNINILVETKAMYLPIHNRSASAYSRVGIETSVAGADAHQLIELLFDGLMSTMSLAQKAIEREDVVAKGKHISKAIRLFDEGLKSGLNSEGGELTNNLSALYDYCINRLVHANLKSDSAAIDEVRNLIDPVAQGWKAIRSQALQGK